MDTSRVNHLTASKRLPIFFKKIGNLFAFLIKTINFQHVSNLAQRELSGMIRKYPSVKKGCLGVILQHIWIVQNKLSSAIKRISGLPA